MSLPMWGNDAPATWFAQVSGGRRQESGFGGLRNGVLWLAKLYSPGWQGLAVFVFYLRRAV